jgi:hypothetical protein
MASNNIGISDENKKILDSIIKYLNGGQMSAFIGAGFSKNACPDFPDWNQLLYKMVDEMYEEELTGFSDKTDEERKKKETKENRIIQREGVLQIPELYIKYKGKREFLTCYIEKALSLADKNAKDFTIHKALLNLPWQDICTTNYDTMLEQAAEEKNNWVPVYSSDQLSEYSHNRIIKLHGSLRKNKEPYSFDGCSNHQYIITQSDYDNYPKQHYGFTAFMQAKMLQEALCMIGYSGNDSDFKYWIYWVRDLFKYTGSHKKPLPIYFIDVFSDKDNAVPDELDLFYKNHNITHVQISDMYDWLQNENHSAFPADTDTIYSNRLRAFFVYLDNHSWNNRGLYLNTQQFDRRDYYECWDRFIRTIPEKIPTYISEYKSIIKSVRIPSPYTMVRTEKFFTYITKYLEDQHIVWDILKVCKIVCDNDLVLPLNFLNLNEFNKFEVLFSSIPDTDFVQDKEKLTSWLDYAVLLLKTYRTEQNTDKFDAWKQRITNIIERISIPDFDTSDYEQEIQYQTGLLYATTFDQKKFYEFLAGWKPEDDSKVSGQWLMKKAFLLNLFSNSFDSDIKETTKTIESLLKEAVKREKKNPQERLWILENYSNIFYKNHYRVDKETEAEIGNLKSNGYFTLQEVTEYLMAAGKPKQEIRPADVERYEGKTMFMGIIPDEWTELHIQQFFRLVEEAGILLNYRNFSWYESTTYKIYPVFTGLQKNYPFTGVCYALMYAGYDDQENFLRKLIQQIVFSELIGRDVKENLLQKLIICFTYRRETGKSTREYLFLISELMRAVPYTEWSSFSEELRESLFSDNKTEGWEKIRKFFYSSNLFNFDIPLNRIATLVDDKNEVKNSIKVYLFDHNVGYYTLNQIQFNPHFRSALEDLCKSSSFIKQLYDAFICTTSPSGKLTYDKILTRKMQSFFIYFPDRDRKKIISHIDQNQLPVYEISLLISFIRYLEYKDSITQYCIGKFLNSIKLLPFNSYPPPFPVTEFVSASQNIKDIPDSFIIEVYMSYREKWDAVRASIDKYEKYYMINTNNLIPYYTFLRSRKDSLQSIQGYKELLNEMEEYVGKVQQLPEGQASILSGSIEDCPSYFLTIIRQQESYKTLDYKADIRLGLYRILIKDDVKNELILSYLVELFDTFRKKKTFLNYFVEPIVLLLKKYKTIPEEHDKILMEDHLIRLAQYFRKCTADPIITYWLERKKNSPFYEVRNLTQIYFIHNDKDSKKNSEQKHE